MKRVIKVSLFVCAILVSTMVKASDVLSVKIENSSTINVSLFNISKGQKLYLKDYSGAVLFNVTLDAMSSYKKYFNLNTVKDGIYFVETETEYDVKVTPVLKNPQGVALINNSLVTIFKPKVAVKNKMVRVMYTKVEKSPLHVAIYDREGYELYSEDSNDDEVIFERTYQFADVPSGKYFIYFSYKDREFKTEVSI